VEEGDALPHKAAGCHSGTRLFERCFKCDF
jgi:hypothetical protein